MPIQDNLFPASVVEPTNRDVSLDMLPPNAALFGPEPTHTLVESMERFGLMQPIVLLATIEGQPIPASAVIAGRRRIKAARALNWPTIPARIYPPGYALSEVMSLVENEARSPNRPQEIRALRNLIMMGATDTHLRTILHLTQRQLDARKRILSLPADLLDGVATGRIAVSVGETASRLTPDVQARLLAIYHVEGGLTTRDVYEQTRAARTEISQGLENMLIGDDEWNLMPGPITADTTIPVPPPEPEPEPVVVPVDTRPWQVRFADAIQAALDILPTPGEIPADSELNYYLGQIEQGMAEFRKYQAPTIRRSRITRR